MELWTRLWGRYHVPQNVFLVYNCIFAMVKARYFKFGVQIDTKKYWCMHHRLPPISIRHMFMITRIDGSHMGRAISGVHCVCTSMCVCLFFHTISQKPMQLDHQTWQRHGLPRVMETFYFGIKRLKVKVKWHKNTYQTQNKKLSYRRGTAWCTMLVNTCYISRAMGVKGFKQQKWPPQSYKGTGNGTVFCSGARG